MKCFSCNLLSVRSWALCTAEKLFTTKPNSSSARLDRGSNLSGILFPQALRSVPVVRNLPGDSLSAILSMKAGSSMVLEVMFLGLAMFFSSSSSLLRRIWVRTKLLISEELLKADLRLSAMVRLNSCCPLMICPSWATGMV